GYWPFAPKIGYRHDVVEGHKGKVLVPEEPAASIIKQGLEGFASGLFESQAELKRYFEKSTLFPRDAHGLMRFQAVTDVLTCPLYAGYVEAPKCGVSLRKGHHQALITLDTFDCIQRRLKAAKKAPTRADINADFPLRGAVACA